MTAVLRISSPAHVHTLSPPLSANAVVLCVARAADQHFGTDVPHRLWVHLRAGPQADAAALPVHQADGGCDGRRGRGELRALQDLLLPGTVYEYRCAHSVVVCSTVLLYAARLVTFVCLCWRLCLYLRGGLRRRECNTSCNYKLANISHYILVTISNYPCLTILLYVHT